jgi:isopenicillin N synthase-like dioxygenase
MSSDFTTIPTISLADWTETQADRDAFAAELCRICHEVGFLLLVDHGVPQEFLDRYFAALERFFALDEATKASIDKRHSRFFRGWERVGAELTDNRPDYREQLDVSTENPPYPADVEPPYLRLAGPNQWLADSVLPGFRDLVLEFFARMGAVADQLMAAMSRGLGLAEDHLAGLFGSPRHSFVKLIRYPPTPAGEAGVNAHHDASGSTLPRPRARW